MHSIPIASLPRVMEAHPTQSAQIDILTRVAEGRETSRGSYASPVPDVGISFIWGGGLER